MIDMNATTGLVEPTRDEASRTSTHPFSGHLLPTAGVWGAGDVRLFTRGREIVPPLGSSLIV